MPSPFPGMDPWLEDEEAFPNLHDSLLIHMQGALNAAMPKGYVARSRTRVWVDDTGRREPDVALVTGRPRPPLGGTLAVMPGLTAVGVERESDPIEEIYLDILSGRGKRLVTSIEVISPTNKKAGGKGRAAYRAKQQECRLGGVHLVEIDLLRRGPHVTAIPLARLRRKAGAFDYHVSVRVADDPARLYAAGIKLADRLPAIGIPLDAGMEPVTVDLQPLLDRVYDGSKYAEDTEYDRPPDPPLTPEQQAWAEGVLREKGVLT